MIQKKQEPLVSIIVNCFNGERFLRQALDSILSQTYQNWEVIFWDNQSTDKSAEIYKSYNEERFKYFYASNHTLAAEARNLAIDKSTGEFIAFLDVDDWWLPSKLEQQIPLFADSTVGIVCGNFYILYEQKNKIVKALKGSIPTGNVLKSLLNYYYVGLLTLVIRRTALNSLKRKFDIRYHLICDMDIVIRLSINWKVDCVQDTIGYYRIHENNLTVTKRSRHVEEYEQWLNEIRLIENIKNLPELNNAQTNLTYTKIKYLIFDQQKGACLKLLYQMPWGKLKLKLLIIFFSPFFIVKKLKGF